MWQYLIKILLAGCALKFHEEIQQAHADVLYDQRSFELLQIIDLRSALVPSTSPT